MHLKGLEGIDKVNDFGKLQEIRVASGVDPQKILAELLKKTRITRFEITKPSLNDIFIRIASPERKEDLPWIRSSPCLKENTAQRSGPKASSSVCILVPITDGRRISGHDHYGK